MKQLAALLDDNFTTSGQFDRDALCADALIKSTSDDRISPHDSDVIMRLAGGGLMNATLALCGGEPNMSAMSADDDDDDGSRPYVPRLWVQIAWSTLFASMVTMAVTGNAIVIWIVIAHKRMRSVTNVFLVNLSCADLMLATMNAIVNFVFMLRNDWPFGQFYCTVNNFVAILTVASSVFTITAISINRYITIMHPMRKRMSRKTAAVIIAFIWLSASLLAAPNLIFSKANTYLYAGRHEHTVCFLVWPDGESGWSHLEYRYNVLILVLTYAIPMASMAIAYSIICRKLWGSEGIGEETEGQQDAVRSKQKVAKMLIAVFLLFGFCWLPYHVFFLFAYHYPAITYSEYVQHMYLAIYWLAMSHSVQNPIILALMNKRFRNYVGQALHCTWRDTASESTGSGSSDLRRESNNIGLRRISNTPLNHEALLRHEELHHRTSSPTTMAVNSETQVSEVC